MSSPNNKDDDDINIDSSLLRSIQQAVNVITNGNADSPKRIWFHPDFTNFDGPTRPLVAAIQAHAPHCHGVTSVRLPHALCQSLLWYISDEDNNDNDSPWINRLQIFLRHIHAFPNLQEIILQGSTDDASTSNSFYTASFQTTIVSNICWSRMKRIRLELQLNLVYHANNIMYNQVVWNALQGATLLEEFTASSLSCQGRQDLLFSPLVETLASLPRLKRLHLGVSSGSAADMVTVDAMIALGRSTTLQNLKLVNFHITDDHIGAFCDAISVVSLSHSTLSCLETVEFDDFLPRITAAGCRHLWNLLQTNYCLTDIQVHCDDSSGDSGGEVKTHTMESEILALCRLNKAGRGRILLNQNEASRVDWISLLLAASESVGVSFLLLQKHPGLCSMLLQQPSDQLPSDPSPPPTKRRRFC